MRKDWIVVVKHSKSIDAPVSAHKTYIVEEVYDGDMMRLYGYPEPLRKDIFERVVIRGRRRLQSCN